MARKKKSVKDSQNVPQYKLRGLSEIRSLDPNFQTGWLTGKGDTICENLAFARELHVVVCDQEDRPIYDQPVWAEAPGAVIVGIDTHGHLALLEHFRTAPVTDAVSTYPSVDLKKHGRKSFEFPRGLAKPGESALETAVREAEEETGLAASNPQIIGATNPNTTYCLFDTPIVLVRLKHRAGRHAIDSTEPIPRPQKPNSVFKPVVEIMRLIRDGQITCGHTKSAFATFMAFESHPAK
jgi:8-oxo-dGTP pyrophosphatase MutT (NUDIX family)